MDNALYIRYSMYHPYKSQPLNIAFEIIILGCDKAPMKYGI